MKIRLAYPPLPDEGHPRYEYVDVKIDGYTLVTEDGRVIRVDDPAMEGVEIAILLAQGWELQQIVKTPFIDFVDTDMYLAAKRKGFVGRFPY